MAASDHPHLDTLRLATLIQSNIRICLRGGLVRSSNCPNLSDLIAEFVSKVEERVNSSVPCSKGE